MSKKQNHHVVPRNNGWAVEREGSQRASGVFDTQRKAIDSGRNISRNQGTELIIHRPNGKIRDRDTHGHDPYPPKG